MSDRKKNRNLTSERANELFKYDSATGIVTRRVSLKGVFAGSIAGNLWTSKSGLRSSFRVGVDMEIYELHRVIWLMRTGEWPDQIDHINHDATDNRWVNLRSVSNKENAMNRSMSQKNTTGITGVYWSNLTKSWFSLIRDNGKSKRLYSGRDFFEACCARRSAEIKYGFHENHGR